MRIIHTIKHLVPQQWKAKFVARLMARRQQKYLSDLRIKILNYYRAQAVISEEQKQVLSYLNSHPVTVFPYAFRNKYDKDAVEVLRDLESQLPYVLHENKRLYFKRTYSDAMIRSLYHGLQLDQDPESPHRYLTPEFSLGPTDVIADIGAAEGNFSLSNVEKVKKIYLFECDTEWIEALEATFSPWKEKVVICNRFVSDTNSEEAISIDQFAKDHDDITFLKVDIEGEEGRFLRGASDFLRSDKLFKMAICTYHKQDDEVEFTALLQSYGLEVSPSPGFMIFYHDHSIKAPYLRRALLRAEKKAAIHD